MQEGAPRPQPKQEKKLPWAEAGLAAAALFAAVDAGPAQALEMDPNTSWKEGIQKLHTAVTQEKNEVATTFLRFTDGSEAWPSTIGGTTENVTINPAKELNFVQEKYAGKKIESRCTIHTHPQQSFKYPSSKILNFPFTSPSNKDIQGDMRDTKSLVGTYALMRMPVKHSISAVADSSGIWYYRGNSEKMPAPEQEEAWSKVYQNFSAEAAANPNFNWDIEYAKLQQAYKVNLSGDIRFVPYDKVASEPACAGVDYKAGARVIQTPAKKAEPTMPKVEPTVLTRPALPPSGTETRQNIDLDPPPTYRVGPPQR
jgi:hypothetical protein